MLYIVNGVRRLHFGRDGLSSDSLDEYLHLVLSLKLFRQTLRLGVDYAAPHSPATLLICHWKGQGQEGDDDDDDEYMQTMPKVREGTRLRKAL